MKHLLIRKIAAIHAIKCMKSSDFNEAIASFLKLNELKEQIIKTDDVEELNIISKQASDWAATNPIATEREINDLMKK